MKYVAHRICINSIQKPQRNFVVADWGTRSLAALVIVVWMGIVLCTKQNGPRCGWSKQYSVQGYIYTYKCITDPAALVILVWINSSPIQSLCTLYSNRSSGRPISPQKQQRQFALSFLPLSLFYDVAVHTTDTINILSLSCCLWYLFSLRGQTRKRPQNQ